MITLNDIEPGQCVRVPSEALPAHAMSMVFEVAEIRPDYTERSGLLIGQRIYNYGRVGQYFGRERQHKLVKKDVALEVVA